MTQATKSFYSNLVGNRFRVSGSLILPVLEIDTPLILDPEPDNPYDPLAVKVCVDISNTKYAKHGHGPVIHLGYLPRSMTKTCTTGFGNKEALNIMRSGPNWAAYLSFSPQGDLLVRIEVYEEAA